MTQITVPGSGSGRSPFRELGLLRGLGAGMRGGQRDTEMTPRRKASTNLPVLAAGS